MNGKDQREEGGLCMLLAILKEMNESGIHTVSRNQIIQMARMVQEKIKAED